MQITREQLNPCTIQFKVVCDPEQVQEGFKKAYKLHSQRMNVPGFRKGQVPLPMLEKLISREEISDYATEEIVKIAYKQVLKDENVEPFETPHVAVEKMDHQKNECEFTVKVPLKPVIELGDYTELSAPKKNFEVTEDELNHQLEQLRQSKASRAAITDRGAEQEDVAVVSIKPEGESAAKTFVIVVGKTFDQLDKALTGMKTGESKTLKLKFPESFQNKDWAKQTLTCEIQLRSLTTMKLPELTDEFVKEQSESGDLPEIFKSKTLAELRGKMKEYLSSVKSEMEDIRAKEKLLDQLIEKSIIHVPDTTWENVAQRRLEDIYQEANSKKQTIEEYATELGKTLEEFTNEIKYEAKEQVIRAFAAKEIFSKENLKVASEDLDKALGQIAAELNMSATAVFEGLKSSKRLNEVNFRAIYNKALDFLGEKANIQNKSK